METTLSFVVPSVTPVGIAPKVSFTDSPSSSTLSEAAAKLKVSSVMETTLSVSVLLKVTLVGTPE